MKDAILLVISFVAILIEGIFSCGELSYISYPKYLLKKLGSKVMERAYRSPEKVFTASLIGTNLFMALATVFFSSFMIKNAFPHPDVLSAVLLIPLIFILGEAGPKLIGRYKSKTLAPVFVPFLWGMSFIFYPISLAVNALREGFQKVIFIGRDEMYTRKTVARMLASSYFMKIGREEIEGLKNLLEVTEKKVRDIMIPLSQVVMIEKSAIEVRLIEYINKFRFSRYPVYEGRVDNVLGIVNLYDYLRRGEIRIVPPAYIPANTSVMNILNCYREKGEEMMVVVDEFGGCVGVVTLKDFWSMFVGEIKDEEKREEGWVEYNDEMHRAVLKGTTDVDTVAKMLGIKIERDEARTISGFITARMGRIPREGEVFEYRGVAFLIKKVSPKRIEEIEVQIP